MARNTIVTLQIGLSIIYSSCKYRIMRGLAMVGWQTSTENVIVHACVCKFLRDLLNPSQHLHKHKMFLDPLKTSLIQ